MSKQIQELISKLEEGIRLRELVIQHVDEKINALSGRKQQCCQEIESFAGSIEILKRQQGGELNRIMASIDGIKRQMASSPLKIYRDFNTILAQVFLYRGFGSEMAVGRIIETALSFELIRPHLKRALADELPKIMKRQGFRVLRRKRSKHDNQFRYLLKEAAKRHLKAKLGDLNTFKGQAQKVMGLANLFTDVIKRGRGPRS